jgi:hypothetical protein
VTIRLESGDTEDLPCSRQGARSVPTALHDRSASRALLRHVSLPAKGVRCRQSECGEGIADLHAIFAGFSPADSFTLHVSP